PNVTCPKQNKLLNVTIFVPKRDSPTSPFNPTITYHPRICVHSYAYAWDSHPLATDQHPTHTTTQSTPPAHFLFPHPPTHMRAILRIRVGTISAHTHHSSAHKGSPHIDLFYA
ncbi:hypothetical protein PIB30_104484, partial [Stylosanthes scabra]|nr:hypothetical protein [Stylosanthes scabra]